MIKTISSKCPNCKKMNAFNVPIGIGNVEEINVPWFQCSFCFIKNKKNYWL
ncbi:hypothetical protein IQ10_02230 [Halalkalibacter nanhaiisediminis]|uniref:Uncharacterized protein n=1 Tax=Halalkalibacter nanhaiisediminis TaxID=688079 RepID=A0A562QJW1_9BACI|nr:hypothetical protein IQ10_02230 [Halalkalibacter nanhaiisediminis]